MIFNFFGFNYIDRWRHTFGYGVHSPLAYRIIRSCIHPDKHYSYYADSRIYSESDDADMILRMKMMIRMIDTLRPSRILMLNFSKKSQSLIAGAFPSKIIMTEKGKVENSDFIAFCGSDISADLLSRIPDAEEFTLVVFDSARDRDSKIESAFKLAGITPTLKLSGSRYCLYLRREGMLPVAYTTL